MSLPPIPINSLQRHVAPLREELAAAATAVIDSGHYVLGPAVTAFEQAFAGYCGSAHCVSVANGTDALELALRTLGIGQGARVAVVANAAMYATTAVLAVGAEPLFVDVLPGAATMDPAQLEAALAANPDVAAVIVTHLYGRLAEIEAIQALCRPRGIRVRRGLRAGARRARARRPPRRHRSATSAASASTRPRTSAPSAMAARC